MAALTKGGGENEPEKRRSFLTASIACSVSHMNAISIKDNFKKQRISRQGNARNIFEVKFLFLPLGFQLTLCHQDVVVHVQMLNFKVTN
jgi:hypothetical protein